MCFRFLNEQLLVPLHPCFIPSSVFYPLNRVLSPHPCFIPSSVFYPLIRVLSPHPCFIPSSVFYPLIRVLSPYPCFIPLSVFYSLIRTRFHDPYSCFIPTQVTTSVLHRICRVSFLSQESWMTRASELFSGANIDKFEGCSFNFNLFIPFF